MEATKSVCIEDFNGKCCGFPTAFWADYWPDDNMVCFGGEWCDIPDMPTDSEPTPRDVNKWAKDHGADIYTL